jgi:hypothetical protein
LQKQRARKESNHDVGGCKQQFPQLSSPPLKGQRDQFVAQGGTLSEEQRNCTCTERKWRSSTELFRFIITTLKKQKEWTNFLKFYQVKRVNHLKKKKY